MQRLRKRLESIVRKENTEESKKCVLINTTIAIHSNSIIAPSPIYICIVDFTKNLKGNLFGGGLKYPGKVCSVQFCFI